MRMRNNSGVPYIQVIRYHSFRLKLPPSVPKEKIKKGRLLRTYCKEKEILVKGMNNFVIQEHLFTNCIVKVPVEREGRLL